MGQSMVKIGLCFFSPIHVLSTFAFERQKIQAFFHPDWVIIGEYYPQYEDFTHNHVLLFLMAWQELPFVLFGYNNT